MIASTSSKVNSSSSPNLPLLESKPQVDVLLVSMPFGPHIVQPSIGLSLLKASLKPLGVSSKILYLTMRLAKRIGDKLYREISDSEPTTTGFAGEWLFAQDLFPDEEHSVEGYIEDVLRGKSPAFGAVRRIDKRLNDKAIDKILSVKPAIGEFMDECVNEVLQHRPRVVGMTSTFQQHAGSLALARRLKMADSNLFILLGGANCEGIMGWETLRQFPFLDGVISGEADDTFPRLISQWMKGQALPPIEGVFLRHQVDSLDLPVAGNGGGITSSPPIHDMDGLPYPDYRDFFEQFKETDLDLEDLEGALALPRLMFETSRGCWWGAKSHCTFCGLNGSTMAFRSKTADRALSELEFLTKSYPGSRVSVVDNILDMKYFKDFVPMLAASEINTELFYEVKANIKKDQLRLMRQAGIIDVQPGIESLSSHVLDLMKKGITGLQNIQFLKWCKEVGVRPYWNMLWGFPGETSQDYAEVLDMMSSISHLPPPGGHGLIRLDRFSPNYNQAEEIGFTDIRPYPAFDYIYKPLSTEAKHNMSYFFTFLYREERDVESYVGPVRERLHEWKEQFEDNDLFSVDKGENLLIWDLRPNASQNLIVLNDIAKFIYQACDGICGLNKLKKMVENETGRKVESEQLESALAPLVESRLMLRDGNSCLSLAIPLGEYSPPRKVVQKFQGLVNAIGKSAGGKIVIDLNRTVRKEVLA